MGNKARWSVGFGAVLAITLVSGCTSGGNSSPTPAPSGSSSASATSSGVGTVQQYAAAATATSSYGTEPGSSWSATNAVGAPTITACGDDRAAWASAEKNTIDTLTVTFATPVIPTEVSVYQNFNPGYITKVTVVGTSNAKTVYDQPINPQASCPATLTVPDIRVDFPVQKVEVTIDQRLLNNWSEIDAVSLTGTPVPIPANTSPKPG